MVMSLHMIKTYLFQLVLFIYGRHASCGTPVQATSANPPTLFLALEGVARSTEAAAKVAAAGGAKLTAAHLADQRFLRAGGCSRAGFLPLPPNLDWQRGAPPRWGPHAAMGWRCPCLCLRATGPSNVPAASFRKDRKAAASCRGEEQAAQCIAQHSIRRPAAAARRWPRLRSVAGLGVLIAHHVGGCSAATSAGLVCLVRSDAGRRASRIL